MTDNHSSYETAPNRASFSFGVGRTPSCPYTTPFKRCENRSFQNRARSTFCVFPGPNTPGSKKPPSSRHRPRDGVVSHRATANRKDLGRKEWFRATFDPDLLISSILPRRRALKPDPTLARLVSQAAIRWSNLGFSIENPIETLRTATCSFSAAFNLSVTRLLETKRAGARRGRSHSWLSSTKSLNENCVFAPMKRGFQVGSRFLPECLRRNATRERTPMAR